MVVADVVTQYVDVSQSTFSVEAWTSCHLLSLLLGCMYIDTSTTGRKKLSLNGG